MMNMGTPIGGAMALGGATVGTGLVVHGSLVTAKVLSGAGDPLTKLFAKTGDNDDLDTTQHGAQRMNERGITITNEYAQTIKRNYTESWIQGKDGAAVYIKRAGRGRYDVLIEGDDGIVTVMRDKSRKELDGLARNYDWQGYFER
jgi:hypothetical protein